MALRMFSRRLAPTIATCSRSVALEASLINAVKMPISIPSVYKTAVSVLSREQFQYTPIRSFLWDSLVAKKSGILANLLSCSFPSVANINNISCVEGRSSPLVDSIWLSSTMKKRRMKMNKHKLKKRRKALRMNTKASREA
jgi:Mitochondrial domain of unknown function (DUF1713)